MDSMEFHSGIFWGGDIQKVDDLAERDHTDGIS